MQLDQVKKVKQVIGEAAANAALAEGWVLISAVTYNSSVSSSGVSGGASVTYVLGKSTELENYPSKLTI
ncbi:MULTISPECIES: hypothetical protein [unclassified Pseudomonas]|uniref:hypothetical protein n=1 Tax=unclassified Pseudomonas TaxID=196821 RepID=UPI0025E494AD|nr:MULTISPECIES: hypothetical protein [unclassified Pseudomonas]